MAIWTQQEPTTFGPEFDRRSNMPVNPYIEAHLLRIVPWLWDLVFDESPKFYCTHTKSNIDIGSKIITPQQNGYNTCSSEDSALNTELPHEVFLFLSLSISLSLGERSASYSSTCNGDVPSISFFLCIATSQAKFLIDGVS